MTDLPEQKDFESTRGDLLRVREALDATIIGQKQLVTELLIGFFAQGHILLEGPPGLGKTHLAKALARTLGYELSRIQCTPDLMPADITGSETLATDRTDLRVLDFRPGPLFAHIVLVDEINRATPRTQAAFLEAMQESQVTHMGRGYALPKPFWVLASQNPIELEGTYPLPEAQLDRFLLKVHVPYPNAESLLEIIDTSLDHEPSDQLKTLLSPAEVDGILALTREIIIAPAIKHAAVNLIIGTHPDHPEANPQISANVRYGSSPRGLQALLRGARVAALIDGRAHVALEDLRQTALPALRHRLLLRFESEVSGMTSDQLLKEMIAECLSG